jgi:two-component system alkaline phosphatase synthesis response regulator PhoP
MAQKILVIDDEPHVVKIVESRLKVSGFEIIAAYGGKEGLEKAKQEKPDLILLDIIMPDIDGLEVLVRLRQDEDTKSIPVIMLSARGETDDIVKSITEGNAKDYIVKPYIAADFLKKINRALAPDKQIPESAYDQEMLEVIEKKVKKILKQNNQE